MFKIIIAILFLSFACGGAQLHDEPLVQTCFEWKNEETFKVSLSCHSSHLECRNQRMNIEAQEGMSVISWCGEKVFQGAR